MGIRYLKKHACLEGRIGAEDAEGLSHWLRDHPRPAVHLGKCTHVHAAALQVLLARRPVLVAPPPAGWLHDVLQHHHLHDPIHHTQGAQA